MKFCGFDDKAIDQEYIFHTEGSPTLIGNQELLGRDGDFVIKWSDGTTEIVSATMINRITSSLEQNGHKLPQLTPPEIHEWVKSVEAFHSVGLLTSLPYDSTLEKIQATFEEERSNLMCIGQSLGERARWDAWESYEDRIDYEQSVSSNQ
ncbi:hypothetical protein [Photobacterium damselae]|uniref:hypothetical protein n=1 Tax=Photobacterium damselae TaxID=38293 RepID=UPI004068CADF